MRQMRFSRFLAKESICFRIWGQNRFPEQKKNRLIFDFIEHFRFFFRFLAKKIDFFFDFGVKNRDIFFTISGEKNRLIFDFFEKFRFFSILFERFRFSVKKWIFRLLLFLGLKRLQNAPKWLKNAQKGVINGSKVI